jgi:hypothetical protein
MSRSIAKRNRFDDRPKNHYVLQPFDVSTHVDMEWLSDPNAGPAGRTRVVVDVQASSQVLFSVSLNFSLFYIHILQCPTVVPGSYASSSEVRAACYK